MPWGGMFLTSVYPMSLVFQVAYDATCLPVAVSDDVDDQQGDDDWDSGSDDAHHLSGASVAIFFLLQVRP